MTEQPLYGKTIVLGVTGSIAAYKSVDLASKLTQAGALVDVVLTSAAEKLVAPITFQSVTGRKAYNDEDLWGDQAHVLHVGLAQKADILVIAPATANTIAKLAYGLADNLLSLTALALTSGKTYPTLVIAPAMDAGMYSHEATQGNLKLLTERGVLMIGPEEGHLASGLVAKGRMTEPNEIQGTLRYLLSRGGVLAGKRVVVTAGGTKEAIDPVRNISNLSSGKQGNALAQAALDLGAAVTLIAPVSSLPLPNGCRKVDVESADEMEQAVMKAIAESDVLIMAAAVADYRPKMPSKHKLKKVETGFSLELERTRDILLSVKEYKKQNGDPKITVGFAAETEELMENARKKMKEKQLDMIVANDISETDSGFGSDSNRVSLIFKDNRVIELPLMPKIEVSAAVMEQIAAMLQSAD